jgi:hypothetical protein
LSICQVSNAAWSIILTSFLGSGKTPPSDDNLEIPLGDGADNQRLKNAVNADTFGIMFRKRLCGRCGLKPHAWWRCAF